LNADQSSFPPPPRFFGLGSDIAAPLEVLVPPFYLCARYRFSFEFLSARALRLHGFLAGLFQAPVVRAMDLDSWTWLFPVDFHYRHLLRFSYVPSLCLP
jgi:hypothetical protein